MNLHKNLLTIRLRLIVIILLAALPAAGLFIYQSSKNYQYAYAEAGQNLQELARLAASNERIVVRGVHDLLTAISEASFIQDGDRLVCNDYLAKISRHYKHYHAFSIINVQGEIICSGNVIEAPIPVGDRLYFDLAMQEKRFVAAGYLVNRVTNTPVVAFVMPILDGAYGRGEVIAMVATTLRLETFALLTRELSLPPGATVSIVDFQGIVLATDAGRQGEVGKPIASDTLRAGLFSDKPHVLEAAGADGVMRLFAIAPALHEGHPAFYAIVGLDKTRLAAPAVKSLLMNLAALCSLVLLSLAGTWVISKKLVIMPVNQLIDTAKQVKSGNLQARTNLHYRAGELGELARHFDDMTASLAQRESEMRASTQYIEHLAHHDELTKLPNRRLLHLRLAQYMEETKKSGRLIAVLFIDLDRFRIINDSLGHWAGDLLLVCVAERLLACLEAKDLVARLGGDEFVCVVTNLKTQQEAASFATGICNRLSEPFLVANERISLGASLGVSLCPTDCRDGTTAVKYAEVAMRQAKESGSKIQFFSNDLKDKAIGRLTLENELRNALEKQEFVLHFQPQVDLQSGQIVGAEALIRWQHPGKGLLAPASFIALAEETRLIIEIGAWTLKAACLQSKAWQNAGLLPVQVAVNVSAYQFKQPGFAELVASALQESRLPAHLLELEVTESVLLNDVSQTLTTLQDMGVALSIDDFGTGYSSLSYLRDLPVDKLKIDQSFIRNITQIPDNQAITRAIISIAKSLGLKVIAEGVDTAATCEFLRAEGCDEMQGFYHSKPMPADQLALLLQRRS